MEEAVWTYFGVIVAILALGIVTTLFITYNRESKDDLLFQGLSQLGRQADIVCNAPKDTQLSVPITVAKGGILYVREDRVCAQAKEKIRCAPLGCTAIEQTLINLTNVTLVDVHEYTCTINHGDKLNITCQG